MKMLSLFYKQKLINRNLSLLRMVKVDVKDAMLLAHLISLVDVTKSNIALKNVWKKIKSIMFGIVLMPNKWNSTQKCK